MFACTVEPPGDLGGPPAHAGIGDVSLDSWACLEGMINVVRRTGHSSFYVEKGLNAIGKTPRDMGIKSDYLVNGGAFPVWLQNAPCCPIAIVAAYGGSSIDDHRLVVTSIRDYLNKMIKSQTGPGVESTEWVVRQAAEAVYSVHSGSPFEPHEYGD